MMIYCLLRMGKSGYVLSVRKNLKNNVLALLSIRLASVLLSQNNVLCDTNFVPQDVAITNANQETFTPSIYLNNTTGNKRKVRSTSCGNVRKVGNFYFLSSPNYPHRYDNNMLCEWNLTAPDGFRHKIIFIDLQLEPYMRCHNDGLEFYDGSSDSAPLIGRFCGYDLPAPIHPSSKNVFLRFKTDINQRHPGFRIFSELKCSCGNDSSCGFGGGQKVCICNEGYAQTDGKCEECSCGHSLSCAFEAGEKLCMCNEGYSQKEGKCVECDCGKNSSCKFDAVKKVCLWDKGYAEKDGKCEECSCGGNYPCVFEDGKKICLCSEQHVQHEGECQKCYCGERHDCRMVKGEKVCYCMDPYKDNNGICEECYCEPGHFCEFNNGSKICVASQSPKINKETYKVLVSLISLMSVASGVLLLGLIYLAARYIKLKRRLDDHSKVYQDITPDATSSKRAKRYEKESLM